MQLCILRFLFSSFYRIQLLVVNKDNIELLLFLCCGIIKHKHNILLCYGSVSAHVSCTQLASAKYCTVHE